MSDDAYRAEVYREDGWWMIRIPALDLLTQAEKWSEVSSMARGVIAADLDLKTSDVQVDVHIRVDPETELLLAEHRSKTGEAERLRTEAAAAHEAAARRLHADGWSYRLIGQALGVSGQRAEQLVNGDPRRSADRRAASAASAAAAAVAAERALAPARQAIDVAMAPVREALRNAVTGPIDAAMRAATVTIDTSALRVLQNAAADELLRRTPSNHEEQHERAG